MIRYLILIFCVTTLHAAHFDVLIRSARVIDGTGNPWFWADVGIQDGKIAAVGNLFDANADRVIEARGRILAPGFIDVHTHVEGRGSRSGIGSNPRADNFILDGVTTIVTGNCGGSEIDLAGWFRRLDSAGLGLNLSTLIGHNSVRRAVMGTENRPASAAELDRMERLVEKAMQDDAVGFSTGLLYVPGTYADTDEIVALAKVAARFGGVYASHIREQGAKLHESIREAVTVGKLAKMPVEISHLKVKGKNRWGTIGKAIALVESFRSQGVDVVVDLYPYDRASTSLAVMLPSWALAGGAENLKARLEESSTRARIIRGMREMLESGGFSDYSHATVASFASDHSLEGKTITEINLLRGRKKSIQDEITTILEMMEQGGAQMVYHFMAMRDVATIMRYPNAAVASDGGIQKAGVGKPHPRSYGTNARVLSDFVRSRRVVTLEDAVRRMTSLPARTFGFQDRGLIRKGLAADLVLFDPSRVQDRATYDRPHQFSDGFDFVFVNGDAVVAEGKLTDARPGKVLRHRPSASLQE